MMIDFHTHRPNALPGTAIFNLPAHLLSEPGKFCPEEGGLYSVGVHPWWIDGTHDDERLWKGVEMLASHPQVVAIGECGLDRLKGDFARQIIFFEKHAQLAETLGKPLVIHCVKAFDEIIAARKRLNPTVQWTIHGFRGKPQQAEQLIRAGFALSFGIKANPAAVRLVPKEHRLFETDDDDVKIIDVVGKFSNIDEV